MIAAQAAILTERDSQAMPQVEHEILRGDLSQVPLREIVEAISQQSISGRLLLSQGFLLVAAYFENGELVHVRAESEQGLEGLLGAFAWTSGNFVLEFDAGAPAHTLRVGGGELVLRGMRRRAGWDSIRKDQPTPGMVFWLPAQGDRTQGSISLSHVEARVLELVDSGRTLADIARASGLGEALTAHTLARLLAAGLVTTNPPRGRRCATGRSRTTIVRRRASWRVALSSLNPLAVLGAGTGLGELTLRVLGALERPFSVHELVDLLGCTEEQVRAAVELLMEAGLVSCAVVQRTLEGLELSPA